MATLYEGIRHAVYISTDIGTSCEHCTEAHVQGVRLNHAIFAGEERFVSVGNGTAL
jgi:hypothetical protein